MNFVVQTGYIVPSREFSDIPLVSTALIGVYLLNCLLGFVKLVCVYIFI